MRDRLNTPAITGDDKCNWLVPAGGGQASRAEGGMAMPPSSTATSGFVICHKPVAPRAVEAVVGKGADVTLKTPRKEADISRIEHTPRR